MKKLAIALAVMAATFISAQAEMLYWQIDTTGISKGDDEQYASRLYYYDGSSMTLLANNLGTGTGAYDTSSSNAFSYDPGSYWIEYGTYANSTYTALGYNGEFQYSDLALSGTQLTSASMRAIFNNAATKRSGHVPEPTSGLMMLVGMALLGLKRRRV